MNTMYIYAMLYICLLIKKWWTETFKADVLQPDKIVPFIEILKSYGFSNIVIFLSV